MTAIARTIRAVFVGDAPPSPTMPPVVVATPAAFVVLVVLSWVGL